MADMDDVGRRGHALPATTFAELPLRQEIKRALKTIGFHAPSPIQLRALPLALFGSDVIGQAKSGTGKTAVFGLAAIEHVLQRALPTLRPIDPLVLIVAPTREIAMQIDSVLRQLAADCGDLRIVPLIGGLPIAQDQKRLRAGCHIVVGTPGRVRWLMEDGVLCSKSIQLLVFDEVDKLLNGEFVDDIDAIVESIPDRRQVLAFSATFTPDQLVHVVQLMRDPQVVRVRGPSDVTVELVPSQDKELAEWIEREKQHEPELWLRQVRQFYRVVPAKTDTTSDPLNLKSKLVLLASLLSEIAFQQCIVFCNDKFRAEALATALASLGWPAAAITGAQTQTTRNNVMTQFRAFGLRVLVSTDLTARGIDVDKVNFVVNLDLPRDPATYLHRIGRTGRFGGKHGLAVTLLTASEVEGIHLLSRVFKMAVDELPAPLPRDIRACVVTIDSTVTSGKSGAATREKDKDDEDADADEDEDDDHDHAAPKQESGDYDITTDWAEAQAVEDEDDEGEVEKAVWLAKDTLVSDGEEATREVIFRSPDNEREEVSTRVLGILHQAAEVLPVRTASPTAAVSTASALFMWEEHCYTQWLRLMSRSGINGCRK